MRYQQTNMPHLENRVLPLTLSLAIWVPACGGTVEAADTSAPGEAEAGVDSDMDQFTEAPVEAAAGDSEDASIGAEGAPDAAVEADAACIQGFADCNGIPSDGCEIDTSSDPQNCGACGKTCSYANSLAGCIGGKCVPGVCVTGYENCNSQPADGCEVDVLASQENCGACGQKCPAAAPCSSGKCTPSCEAGTGDCDNDGSNGCESDLQTDPVNCGGCGTQCPENHECVDGVCFCPYVCGQDCCNVKYEKCCGADSPAGLHCFGVNQPCLGPP